MKKLNIFKNVSNKHKLMTTVFSLALVTSVSLGCTEENYVYVVSTDNGREIVLSEEHYNELIESNDESFVVRYYGGTFYITKDQLYEATCQKQKPNSLHK